MFEEMTFGRLNFLSSSNFWFRQFEVRYSFQVEPAHIFERGASPLRELRDPLPLQSLYWASGALWIASICRTSGRQLAIAQ